jgi:hypothetical protein
MQQSGIYLFEYIDLTLVYKLTRFNIGLKAYYRFNIGLQAYYRFNIGLQAYYRFNIGLQA